MLKSRTVEDALINRFDLRKVYSKKRYQDARKVLEKRSEIDPEKEGLISIASHRPRSQTRRRNRQCLGRRTARAEPEPRSYRSGAASRRSSNRSLPQERDELAKAESACKQIEQKTGLIQPDAANQALIGAVADIRAQIAAKQVQLQSLRTFATENNPDVKRVERELAELQAQSAKLSQTESAGSEPGRSQPEVPTRRRSGGQPRVSPCGPRDEVPRVPLRFSCSSVGSGAHRRSQERGRRAGGRQSSRAGKEVQSQAALDRRHYIRAAFLLISFAILVREAIRRKRQDPVEAARLAQLNRYLRSSL